MYWANHYWGMQLFWWVLWMVIVTLLVFMAWPGSRIRRHDDALDALRRSYAAGEISEDEYRHRLAVLDETRPRDTRARPAS